jgi:hypothetical protein
VFGPLKKKPCVDEDLPVMKLWIRVFGHNLKFSSQMGSEVLESATRFSLEMDYYVAK